MISQPVCSVKESLIVDNLSTKDTAGGPKTFLPIVPIHF